MRTFITVGLFLASLVFSLVARADEPRHDPPRKGAASSDDGSKGQGRDDDALDVGVLGGVGFPRPLSVEAVARLHRTVLLGAEYGFLPATSIASVDTRLWAAAGDVRLFPFKGGFFVGLRGGYQKVSAETTLSASDVGSFTQSVDVGTWFVNPRLGFLWVWKPLALGIDAGVQIPVATTVSRSSLLSVAAPELDARITTATNVLGRTVIPTVDLLRVGLVL